MRDFTSFNNKGNFVSILRAVRIYILRWLAISQEVELPEYCEILFPSFQQLIIVDEMFPTGPLKGLRAFPPVTKSLLFAAASVSLTEAIMEFLLSRSRLSCFSFNCLTLVMKIQCVTLTVIHIALNSLRLSIHYHV